MPDITRIGAEIMDVGDADHVFLGTSASPDIISHIAVGSDCYPDDGATVMTRNTMGKGPTLRPTGAELKAR